MFKVTYGSKENAKWGLGGTIIDMVPIPRLYAIPYPMSGYVPMTKYLSPVIGTGDFPEPNLFDTREEVIKWVEEIKKEFSSITPPLGKDAFISTIIKYAKYPVGSIFFGIEAMKKIEVIDIEDNGFKVKCMHPDDSISYYLFKPCTIEDDGWRF